MLGYVLSSKSIFLSSTHCYDVSRYRIDQILKLDITGTMYISWPVDMLFICWVISELISFEWLWCFLGHVESLEA